MSTDSGTAPHRPSSKYQASAGTSYSATTVPPLVGTPGALSTLRIREMKW